MEFKDQYKHPNWQKKRLEVLAEKGFFCTCCDSEENQLHVHHKRYIKGRKIWEYNIDEFLVLCNVCHESMHFEKNVFDEVVARAEFTEYISYAALLFNFVGAFVHPEDEIELGLNNFDPLSMLIGAFARHAREGDFSAEDVKKVLSLNPDDFHALAQKVGA